MMRGPLILECPDGRYPKIKIDISKSGQCTIVHLKMETLKPFFLNIPTLKDFNVATTGCMTNIHVIFDFF